MVRRLAWAAAMSRASMEVLTPCHSAKLEALRGRLGEVPTDRQ
jgi:hypothetical protein